MTLSPRSPFLSRRLLATASFGLGAAIDLAVTVEWSFPYCNQQYDGPAYAVFGVIPYERFSGASSLVYDFQPGLFAANLALVWLTVAGVLLAVGRWTSFLSQRGAVRALAAIGAVLAMAVATHRTHMWSIGWWAPVASVAEPPHTAFSQLRPVGLTLGRHYDCKPSDFWFNR